MKHEFLKRKLVKLAAPLRSTATLLSLLIAPIFVHAGDYQEDLGYFTNAALFAGDQELRFREWANPFNGPTEYRLPESHAPWAGNYFPMADGGLAQRWKQGGYPKKTLDEKMTTRELKRLSANEIRNLSPIEKYDLLVGDYGFQATRYELENRGPLRALKPQEWEGFCNGARCAGGNLPEPVIPVQFTNPDGLKIMFEPADLKALAGASYFYVEKYAQIGAPTMRGTPVNRPNPAVFDLAIRYYLSVLKRSFIVDSNIGPEIWNESVVGYKRTLGAPEPLTSSERSAFPMATKKVKVSLTLETLGEVEIPDSNRPTKARVARGDFMTSIETGYTLYLDSSGRSIDGKWARSQGERGVDFAWFGAGKGTDEFEKNNHLRFDVVKTLVKRSSSVTCWDVFARK